MPPHPGMENGWALTFRRCRNKHKKMFKVEENPKDLERGFHFGTMEGHRSVDEGKAIEFGFDFPGLGKLTKTYPTKFVGDTDEKRELEGLYGKPLRQVTNLNEIQGRKVVAFVGVKRASGGRPAAYIGPVITLESFKRAAAAIEAEIPQAVTTN